MRRNKIITIINEYIIDSPIPRNLNYIWNIGSLLGIIMIIIIISGITISMHYTANII
jgi:quinol-cytochrome oxidoreductase complex cytochrome b subunit